MTALVVITDGRWQYLERCLESLAANVSRSAFGARIVINDSGEPFPLRLGDDWDVVTHERRRGLAGAVQSAWAALPKATNYVFHLEEDFCFNEPVDVGAMASVLGANPHLAQLVLKRQPWSPEEVTAGGIIECHPEDYLDRQSCEQDWVEHDRIFSLNPCLYPYPITRFGWPDGNEAEMTELLVHLGYSFGFWGKRDDPPRVTHIGVQRSAGWKL